MQTEQPKKHQVNSDYNFSLKVIIILVAVEVFILVCISFVKIYVDRKHSVLNRMRDEAEILQKIFVDDTEFSAYTLNQIAGLIRGSYNKPERVNGVLAHYTNSISDKNYFGWHGFYWIDKEGVVKNVNNDCVIPIGTNLSYLSNVRLSKVSPGKVFFSPNPNTGDELTTYLDLALGVQNYDGEYVGTLLLEIETATILEDLEMYRRNNYTDFAIIDSRLNIITSYPINASRIGLNGKTISNERLQKAIEEINFFDDKEREVSYLHMFSGKNFLLKKIKDKPYVMVVSLDPVHIKTTFTKKVALKFLEISILASFFLVIILMIYKRETWLRAKSERASQIATKAMVAKSDFLSYTAHEIRSPLGFILTGSEIMSKQLFGPIPEQYQDYVSGIHHNSKLILDFINDILDEKHVASGNIKMEEKLCDIKVIIEKALLTNRTRFHARKINIESEIDKDLPFILGDERKILQMASNLISNSFKYSLDGTKITVGAKLVGNELKIFVTDQGIGMTQDEIEIAMTKYGTVHENKSINFIESYGLGLPIVLMLTKAHEAHFDIESEVGVGTTVFITFPSKRIINNPDEYYHEKED